MVYKFLVNPWGIIISTLNFLRGGSTVNIKGNFIYEDIGNYFRVSVVKNGVNCIIMRKVFIECVFCE